MTPQAAADIYRRALKGAGPGWLVTLTRSGDATAYKAAGYIAARSPAEALPGGMVQNTRKLVLLAEDVAAVGFPAPIRIKQDRVTLVDGGAVNAIRAVAERRVQGVLVAYEIELDGA